MTPVRTAARALLASVFVVNGAEALNSPDRLVERAKPVADRLAPIIAKASPRIPTDARSLVQINAAVQVVGGMMLLTPFRRVAAMVLAGSLVPTTLAGHPFWKSQDPVERAMHRSQALKNLGLLGGTLLAAVDNDGDPGLRWRASHLASDTSHAVRRATGNAKSKAVIAQKSAALGRKSAHHI
jgi:putative oxidoreductase